MKIFLGRAIILIIITVDDSMSSYLRVKANQIFEVNVIETMSEMRPSILALIFRVVSGND